MFLQEKEMHSFWKKNYHELYDMTYKMYEDLFTATGEIIKKQNELIEVLGNLYVFTLSGIKESYLKQIKFIDLIIKTKSYLLMGVTIERLMEKRAALEKDLERMDLTYGQRAIDQTVDEVKRIMNTYAKSASDIAIGVIEKTFK